MDDMSNETVSTNSQNHKECVDTNNFISEEPTDTSLTVNSTPQITSDEKTMGILSHSLGFLGIFPFFFGIFGPLIIWLIKRNHSVYVNDEAKEALNFQISFFIYWLIIQALFIVYIGVLLIPIFGIFQFVVTLLATMQATKGGGYKYPLCIRFIS